MRFTFAISFCITMVQNYKIFFLILLLLLLFFYFTILYWFCHTSTCIHHGCTCVPNPEPPSHLPSHTIPLGHPGAPTTSILYPASNLDWRFISYMILYIFQCYSPKSSPTSLSHRVQKTVLYICVSFAVRLILLFYNLSTINHTHFECIV